MVLNVISSLLVGGWVRYGTKPTFEQGVIGEDRAQPAAALEVGFVLLEQLSYRLPACERQARVIEHARKMGNLNTAAKRGARKSSARRSL